MSNAEKRSSKQVSALVKNEFVVLKDRPCKIVGITTPDNAKETRKIKAIDIFTSKLVEETLSAKQSIDVPVVNRMEYKLLDISDDEYLSLMGDDCDDFDRRDDLKLPAGELGVTIVKEFKKGGSLSVTVQSSMGEEAVLSFHTKADN